MDEEDGFQSKDQTKGSLAIVNGTRLLTFTKLPFVRTVGATTILDREFTRNINIRGVVITLKKTTSSVTSGQAEGATTPEAGSTSPQSLKVTFTLYTRKEGEEDFKQVVIDNTTREVSENCFERIHLLYLFKKKKSTMRSLNEYTLVKQTLPFSCLQFTLSIEAIQSEMRIFPIGEPLLKGIKELRVDFTDVVGVSGTTIELSVLGCAEGNPFLVPRKERFSLG